MRKLAQVRLLIIGIAVFAAGSSGAQEYGSCTTPKQEPGICVELQQCKYLFKLLTTRPLTEAKRSFLTNSQCGYVHGRVIICCLQQFADNEDYVVGAPTSLPEPPDCGTTLSNRIYGGNVTSIDEFPWMALIEYTKPGNVKGHHCGGTLIDRRHVLTAAHCVKGPGLPVDWQLSGVRLGEWDLTTNPDCEVDHRGHSECVPEYVDVDVAQVIAHPQYERTSRTQLYDIALLRLAADVTITDFVRPICLPSGARLRSDPFTGTAMDVAGWGKTEKNESSTLKLKAVVDVWPLERCRAVYSKYGIDLQPTQICAGGKQGIDSCRGDSGGPLMVQERVAPHIVYFLAGTVSFGATPCGLLDWPGVYTRVGAFIDWIQENIRT